MLNKTSVAFPLNLLNLAACLTIAATGIAGIARMPSNASRLVAFGLLIVLGALYRRMVIGLTQNQPRVAVVSLMLQTLLVTFLSLLDLSSTSSTNYLAMLFFMLSAEVMLVVPQKIAVVWIGVFALVSGAIYIYASGIESGLRMALIMGAGYFFFGAFASALRQAQTAHTTSAQLLDELQIAHNQLRAYADQVERLATMEERNRLAREMHDSLGHRLTVAAVQLEGAQRLIVKDPDRAAHIVETVREQVRDSLGDLRRTVAALRQPEQVEIALPQAIQQLATSFGQATGLAVQTVLPNALPDLPLAHRLTLYRAAQEGLTNVQHHAQAKNILLVLSCERGMVALSVSDDGVGYPETKPTGFGLLGLKERATLLGGQLSLENRPEGGAQLTLSLPWSASVEEKHD